MSNVSEPPAANAPPVRRGATLFFVGSVVGQAVALARYVVLARILGPEQLGLAATLVVTAAFFDLITETASDRFLVLDRHGNEPDVQRLVQLVYVARGAMTAVALVVFAVPLSAFYKSPKLAFGFMFLGLVRLILGFSHMDMRRVQRDLDFRPDAIITLIAEIVSLAGTAVAAWLTRSFTAILYGLTLRAAVIVLLSHLSAKRPYGLKWSSEHGARLTKFSGPLILTGFMLFIGTQGDRVMVGNQLGPKALGEYSAILLLVYSPAAVLYRYMHTMYVPLVAAGRDDEAVRNRVGDTLGGQTILIAMSMAIGFAVVAPFVVPILYGGRYAQAPLLTAVVGILTATRFLMNWPSTVSISMGKSQTVLISYIGRLSVFPLAIVGLHLFGGLPGLVSGFIVGETFSVAMALGLLNRDAGRPLLTGFGRLATFVSVALLIVGWDLILKAAGHPWAKLLFVIPTLAVGFWVARREAVVIGDSASWATALVRARLHRAKRPASL